MADEKKTKVEEPELDEVEDEELEDENENDNEEGGMPKWAKKMKEKMEELEQKFNQHPKKEEKESVVMIPEPVRKTPEELEQEQEQEEPPTPKKPTAREKASSLWNWFK